MEFSKVVEQRTSVRSFTSEPVPEDILREMVRIAGMAPCIGGIEVWNFVAITNRDLIEKMAHAVKAKYDEILPKNDERITESVRSSVEMFSSIFTKAPAVIAVLAEPYTAIIDKVLSQTSHSHSDINKLRNYPDIQTMGAAIGNLLLAATDLGYGACWQTGAMVAKEELSKLIGIKEPFSLIAFVAVGKPDSEVMPRMKKPVEEIFSVIQ
ncbi:MAG: nitroreductase family protein [Ignavibacteria bacterium]|nr:nitroreductase family protein [Ignavibacteria bacterium]